MIILSILIFLVSLWVITNTKNPINTSFIILVATSILFFSVSLITNIVWIPLIYFILFTGGILIIFIILSSILPNENTLNINYPNTMSITFILSAIVSISMHQPQLSSIAQINSFFTTGLNITFIATIILTYFFSTINLASSEETPMRSSYC